jgi:hypothetical protein
MNPGFNPRFWSVSANAKHLQTLNPRIRTYIEDSQKRTHKTTRQDERISGMKCKHQMIVGKLTVGGYVLFDSDSTVGDLFRRNPTRLKQNRKPLKIERQLLMDRLADLLHNGSDAFLTKPVLKKFKERGYIVSGTHETKRGFLVIERNKYYCRIKMSESDKWFYI